MKGGISLGVALFVFTVSAVRLGAARPLYLGAVAAQIGSFAIVNRFLGWRVSPLALGYPACALLFAGLILRSTALTLLRGGIYWRGAFYSLSLLERR